MASTDPREPRSPHGLRGIPSSRSPSDVSITGRAWKPRREAPDDGPRPPKLQDRASADTEATPKRARRAISELRKIAGFTHPDTAPALREFVRELDSK